MQTNVNVVVKEDDSVQEKIRKTAVALDKKYSKKRKVNEKMLLKGQSKVARVFSIIIDAVLITMCIVCCLFGLSSFIFKLNNLPPSFAGYSFMQISSGSMVKAGFDIGDTIVVQKVDTKTLNLGDYIAFYVYTEDWEEYNYLATRDISDEKETTVHSHSLSIGQFIGVPTEDIAEAGKARGRLVFHVITAIHEDENGMYWFRTKGASNATEDYWHVSERMVVGVYNDSAAANFMSGLLQMLSSNTMILIIIAVPLILMSIAFVFKMIKRVQLARLELDCIEEKRKITDEICVKNDIGFNMSKRDKYKILVQAPENKREEYLALLWKDGSAPNSIRKYVIRQKFRLKENEQRLELNRTCEQMREEGKSGEEIAKFYLEGKEKIEKEQQRYKRIFKSMRKKNQEEKEKAKAEAKALENETQVESAPVVEVPAQEIVETPVKTEEISVEAKEEKPKTIAKKTTSKTGTKTSAAKPAGSKVAEKKTTSTAKKPASKTTAKKTENAKTSAKSSSTAKKTTSKTSSSAKKTSTKGSTKTKSNVETK
ncbi:MAG: hypothetical protein IJZ62_04260 [Clostridia bacterium]|nr:hypothetical protein [Clostridia bacterium]